MRLEQFRPGRTHDEQRNALRPVREMLEKREHRRVGPVDVLDHEHEWTLLRHRLDEPAPGREQLLLRRTLTGIHPNQRQEPGQQPGPVPRLR